MVAEVEPGVDCFFPFVSHWLEREKGPSEGLTAIDESQSVSFDVECTVFVELL